MNEKELAEALQIWFTSHNYQDKNFWARNEVAQTLRNNLKKWDHWKNKKRGKPRYRF